jgi:hypothetical protein
MRRRVVLFVLFSLLLSGCAVFHRDPVDTAGLAALAKRHVLGAWQSEDGSTLRFWCNGTVSVAIAKSDEEDPAKNFFGSDRWTGGMTTGSGTVTGFSGYEIAVQAMLGTHHWQVTHFPERRKDESAYSMVLENLRFYAAPEKLTDCREEW